MHHSDQFDQTHPEPIMSLTVVAFLILSLISLTGCSAVASGSQPAQVAATSVPAETVATLQPAAPSEAPAEVAPALTSTPVSPSETTVSDKVETETSAASATQAEAAPPPVAEPEIGELTFALGATETYEPIEANLLFASGITKIHAIFTYNNMQPGYTWERVWYLNDKEIARNKGLWSGPTTGVFDYFIDNGGRPLPAGDWILELYVEGQLRSLGVFVIEEAEASSSDSNDPPAQAEYLLAYTRCEGDHHNIYVSDTTGRNEQLLVSRGAGPSWAPGGGALFFYGEPGVDRQVRQGLEYVFDGVSNGLVAVNTSPLPVSVNQLNLFQSLEWKQGTARWANVSPDGSMVAFDAKPSGDYRIYFLGTATNQQFHFEILGEQADWAPDGQQVVYRSGRDGQTGLWISNRDDTGHRLLTNGGSDSFPVWSPDGQKIAFSRDEGGNVDIYTVNIDGTDLQRLTDAPGHDTLPAYSPTGEIFFRSTRTGHWGIWKIGGDGANPLEIVPDACVGNDWAYSRIDVAG
jgi:hypothetical protein